MRVPDDLEWPGRAHADFKPGDNPIGHVTMADEDVISVQISASFTTSAPSTRRFSPLLNCVQVYTLVPGQFGDSAGRRRYNAGLAWRCVNAPHLFARVRARATFVDGIIIEREEQRYAA